MMYEYIQGRIQPQQQQVHDYNSRNMGQTAMSVDNFFEAIIINTFTIDLRSCVWIYL